MLSLTYEVIYILEQAHLAIILASTEQQTMVMELGTTRMLESANMQEQKIQSFYYGKVTILLTELDTLLQVVIFSKQQELEQVHLKLLQPMGKL